MRPFSTETINGKTVITETNHNTIKTAVSNEIKNATKKRHAGKMQKTASDNHITPIYKTK
jgi:hypothetical protein